MFKILSIAQRGSDFDGVVYQDKKIIGTIGKNNEGFYINLAEKLTIQETIDLLKVVNGMQMTLYQSEVTIEYIKQGV